MLVALRGCDVIMMCVSGVRPEAEALLWALALETTQWTGTHTCTHAHTHREIHSHPKSNTYLAPDLGAEVFVCSCWCVMLAAVLLPCSL